MLTLVEGGITRGPLSVKTGKPLAVVTAPTAVSWLAAGAGVATAKVLYDTSWTSFGQPREPFAPSCVLMMPEKRGDWANAFAMTARWIRSRNEYR